MRPEDHPLDSSGFASRGEQIDQLDALLTARRAGATAPHARMAPAGLAPLLAAADTLAPFADAQPSAGFAARLEARLMARVEAGEGARPVAAIAPARARARSARLARLTWAAVAACVLLGMMVGALTASAHPGAPLYSLRKAVEGIGADLTGGPAATARDNLQRASAALAAFNAAASQGDNTAALTALGQLTQADHQAADAIAQVGDSGQRAALQSQLDSLRSQEVSDLRAGLSNLDWPARIQVTNALRALNATRLVVTSARIIGASGGGANSTGHDGNGVRPGGQVTVIVTGAGFSTGAVLLINGQQTGVVDSVTQDTLVAHLDAKALDAAVTSVGVGEPDGSAAITTHIESDGHASGEGATPGDHATPGAEATPSEGGDSTPTPQKASDATPSPTNER